MLNTIYETGYDLHVANYVAYLHTDKKLYEDEAHKVQAKKADVEKAFKLGRLIVMAADKTYLPVALMAAGVVVTDGTTATTFSPDAPCTRAQAVTFLFRGAIANGLEAVTLQELISGFSDAASLPGYAVSAMNWALANGIVQGNGGALMPNNICTRGQIVTFLYRASK